MDLKWSAKTESNKSCEMQSKNFDCIPKEIYTTCATAAWVTSVYAHGAEDESIYKSTSVTGFLRLTHDTFWLASHPDNGAEPVCAAGGDIGVVHTADSSSTAGLSGGLAHTQL